MFQSWHVPFTRAESTAFPGDQKSVLYVRGLCRVEYIGTAVRDLACGRPLSGHLHYRPFLDFITGTFALAGVRL